MQNQSLFLSIVIGVAIFLFIIGIASAIYQNNNKNTRYFKEHPEDWFFYKFSDKLFSALYGVSEPEDVAIKFKIDVEEYYKNCSVLGIEPNIRGIVTDYIYGTICLIISIVFSILFHPLFIMLGLSLMLYFIENKRRIVKSRAEKLRNQLKAEFPRFLGMLSTELDVGLPIDTAIELLSKKYDAIITREFLNSLNNVKLGAVGWQGALYEMSAKYGIDEFSDFVMDVTTAFNKGTSIADSVRERTKDIKQKRLYDIKEKASRTENAILVPIAIFQFIPMIGFILLPTFSGISFL